MQCIFSILGFFIKPKPFMKKSCIHSPIRIFSYQKIIKTMNLSLTRVTIHIFCICLKSKMWCCSVLGVCCDDVLVFGVSVFFSDFFFCTCYVRDRSIFIVINVSHLKVKHFSHSIAMSAFAFYLLYTVQCVLIILR